MKNKEFYHFFANGKRYDLLKDGKFIYFRKEKRNKNSAFYEFVYHLSDSNFRDDRSSIFVSFSLTFDPLYYHERETRNRAGKITALEIEKANDCPYAILSKVKEISNYFFPCEKKVIDKESLIKKMEKDLNSHWESYGDYSFYVSYQELYSL